MDKYRIVHVCDAFRNLTEISQRQAGGEGVTTFENGPLGNPVKQTSQLRDVTAYETDGEGNVIKVTDADGNINTFVYDARNMMSEARYADKEPAYFTYDAMGNLTGVDEEIGVTAFIYDKRDRLSQMTGHDGYDVSYGYDPKGNKTLMVYPDGEGALYTYDHMDRLGSLTYQGEKKTYQYSPKSELIQEIYPSGVRVEFAYNNAGYLTESKEVDKDGYTRRQTIYAYRDNGLLWNETKTGIDIGKNDEITTHAYDKSGKLTRTVYDGKETGSYRYDIAGNLITEVRDGKEAVYTYNAGNRMASKASSGKTTTFGYDNRGNLITETSAEGAKSYEYDATGRLTGGTNESGEISTYTYNALGIRVSHEEIRDNYNAGHQNGPYFKGSWQESETLGVILRESRYDWQRIWETNVAGTVVQNDRETVTKHYIPDYTSYASRDIFIIEDGSFIQSFVYDGMRLRPSVLSLEYADETERTGECPGENPGSDIAKKVTTKAWYHGDHLIHSNLFGTDAEGDTIFHMVYDEWGLPQIETRLDMNYHGLDNINNFTGYAYDEVLHIYYAQNRFYDPDTRRFVQQDAAKDGHNWYSYCGNNPIKYIDPIGTDPVPTWATNISSGTATAEDYKAALAFEKSGDIKHYAPMAASRIQQAINTANTVKYPGATLERRDVIRLQVWLSSLANPSSTDVKRPNYLNPTVDSTNRATHGDFHSSHANFQPAFMSSLENAIKTFQAQHGLTANGKMNEATWYAICQEYYATFKPCEMFIDMWNPVDNMLAHFSSSFGLRDGSQHTGIDIGGGTKTVYAALGGIITRKDHSSTFGNNIKIQSGIYTTWYKHLANETDVDVKKLKVGDSVRKGQKIGTTGDTGNSTRSGDIHLHFEVHVNGIPVDPWRFLQ